MIKYCNWHKEHECVGESLSSHTEPISLESCLAAFTKEEHLSEAEKYYCSACQKHQLASKKLEIWRLPPILVSYEIFFIISDNLYLLKINV